MREIGAGQGSDLREGGVTMNLVERVKAILLSPKTEWPVIESESGDAQYLFTNYVAILAAVPAVAALIGYTLFGLGLGSALIFAIFGYLMSCIAWYFAGLVIDGLAPTFGGIKNFPNALKVASYSWTAAWVSGIFHLIPRLSVLILVGVIYSIYLLWLGLPVLMKSPPDRAAGYTAAVAIVVFVVMIIVGMIIARLLLPF
jgi:Yip1-like protein